MKIATRFMAGLVLAVLAAPACPQAPAPVASPPSASSWPVARMAEAGPRHWSRDLRGTFGGRSLRYRAELAELIVADRTGRPTSAMFATAFTAAGKDADRARPVIFVFNGGPGGASNTLMFGALGPDRLARFDPATQADPAARLVANPDSPLDAADLVFVDAPETGFGRPLPGTDPTALRSNDGDSFAFTQAVLRWLADRGRLGAPVYLAGESYGSLRAVMMARDLRVARPAVAPAGLILISQAINYNGAAGYGVKRVTDPLRAATRLVDIAALAWYHGLIDNRGQTLEQAVSAAREFGLGEYATALIAGDGLDAAGRARIADRLAALTGVPAATWAANGLRMDAPRRQLLVTQGKALGQFDGRETEPLAGAVADEARDWDALVRGLTVSSERYATGVLGVSGLPAYRSIVPDPYGFERTWAYLQPPAAGLDVVLREQMQANPGLRLLVTQGVFDTTSSMGATDYLFSQIAPPRDRTEFARYAGGHMLYSEDAGRRAFTADIRAFVRGRPIPSRGFPAAAPGTPSR